MAGALPQLLYALYLRRVAELAARAHGQHRPARRESELRRLAVLAERGTGGYEKDLIDDGWIGQIETMCRYRRA